MNRLYMVLSKIKKMPEMYLGERDIWRLACYLFGFTYAIGLNGFHEKYREFLKEKHGETSLVWAAILEKEYVDPFEAFFETLEEFKDEQST